MRLNARGGAAMGVGDGVVSIDGVAISYGGGVGWIDDDRLLFQRSPDYRLCVHDQRDGSIAVASERGANAIAAGGGRWAAWLSGYGAYASTGDHLPDAGLLDVGPDGAFAYVPDRQAGVGYRIVTSDGRTAGDDTTVVSDFRCYSDVVGYWVGPDGSLRSNADVPILAILGERMYRPVAVPVGDDYWVIYATGVPGDLRGRPVNSPMGVIIDSRTLGRYYNHDAVALDSVGTIKVGWSVTQGERPEDLRTLTGNILSLSRVDFRSAIPDPPAHVTPFDRPLWMSCFKDDAGDAPGNAIYRDGIGLLRKRDGALIAWPTGDLDDQGCPWRTAAGAPLASVELYLGGLKGEGGNGYLNPPATPAEAVRQALTLAQRVIGPLSPDLPLLLICQSYDRNGAWLNEDTLVGMQPAWAEIVRRYPQVYGLLFFSWRRTGGILDHPRLRPWIDAYAAAIPGEPGL